MSPESVLKLTNEKHFQAIKSLIKFCLQNYRE